MRHDLTLSGYAFRLRPVGDEDAAFIAGLRADPTLNRFLHRSSPGIEAQLAWLSRYYERPDDYYFVVEHARSATREGLVSLYDVDAALQQGEWGRWILRPGSMAATESAWLIYRCAFERLLLDRVYCRTVAENLSVVSFHDSCGISDKRLLPGHFEIDGRRVDAVEHRVARSNWSMIETRLAGLANLIAKRLRRD